MVKLITLWNTFVTRFWVALGGAMLAVGGCSVNMDNKSVLLINKPNFSPKVFRYKASTSLVESKSGHWVPLQDE